MSHDLQSIAVRDGASTDTIALVDAVRLLWRRRLAVLVSLIACVLAGLGYLNFAPSVYLATTQLLVERGDVALDRRTQLRYEPAFVQTQAEIVRSRAVVERALLTYAPPSLASTEDPVTAAMDAIRVTPVEGTDVMQVSFSSAISTETVDMLESLVTSYREYLRDSEKDTQLQTLTFLTESERELRAELDDKEEAYRQLRSSSALLGVGQDAGRVQTEYLTNLGKSLTDVKSRRLQLQNQVAVWEKSPVLTGAFDLPAREGGVVQASFDMSTTNDRGVADHHRFGETFSLPKMQELGPMAEIRALQEELDAARNWELELDGAYGDNHPDLRAARSQIRAKQSRLQDMLAAIPRVLEVELDSVRMHEAALEELYGQEVERTRQLDIHELEEQQLLANVERLRAVHDSILTEMRNRQSASASAEQGQGFVHVRTIAAPRSTGKAVWPISSVVLAICGVVGLCGGGTLALLLEGLPHRSPRRRALIEPDTSSVGANDQPRVVQRRQQVANAN